MKVRSTRLIPAAVAIAVLWLGIVATPQARPQQKPKMAEDVFKNIQVLKGTSVDDFLGTMGIMSAAVGFDCSECHANAGTDKVDWAADTPKKLIARRMVTMVAAINKENFNSRQMVTCWSCHHGRDRPATTPAMETVYGPGSTEMDDVLAPMPGMPSADEVLDKYLRALGGADRLSHLTSYVGTGTSVGFGGFGGGAQVQIFAKSPDKHTTLIEFKTETGRGYTVRSYNGRAGWIKTPLAVLAEYELTGSELDGARLDAQLAFPGQIKQVLTNLRVSLPASISDLPGPASQTAGDTHAGIGQDRMVNVVQGTSAQGLLATLYFDKESGLLLRMVRYGKTPIGRVPTQIDFADYRDEGGIKFPHRLIFAWLDGRDVIELNQIQTNVPIDEARFGTPTSVKGQ
ncbi:MAG TPA: photosynthetic reaction center cytochrome c subunit family protein [Bryobacteraceae bacterium]|nr:photosynthetic reaction center cytochrome c subunit family protein [Bryobacteraceae bacterium]